MHIGVKALEQSVPPVCLATLRGLYRLGETVGLRQARAAAVGFIKYQVGCDGIRDTGGSVQVTVGAADGGSSCRWRCLLSSSRCARRQTRGAPSDLRTLNQRDGVTHMVNRFFVDRCTCDQRLCRRRSGAFNMLT